MRPAYGRDSTTKIWREAVGNGFERGPERSLGSQIYAIVTPGGRLLSVWNTEGFRDCGFRFIAEGIA